jgi:hypothetical protein
MPARKLLLTTLLMLSGMFGAFAQTQFTPSPEKFLSQVKDYLGQYDKKMARDFMDMFEKDFLKMPGNVQSDAYNMANNLSAKQAKPFPEFFGYFTGLHSLYKSNLLSSVYPTWVAAIEKTMTARDKKQLPDFLQFSLIFYTDGSVYKTQSTTWKANNAVYKYDYDNAPKIIFEKVDIRGFAKGDSSVIYGTSGTLYPLKDKFDGKGGIITYERAGLLRSETFAELKRYDINLKSLGFDVDTVTFHTTYFKEPLSGRMIERITNVPKPSLATYPQFQSFSKRLFIKNIFPGIDYEGGFMLHGANLRAFGTSTEPAKLTMYRNGKVFLRSSSLSYTIKPEAIDAEVTANVIYIEKDSIYHPGLRLKYTKADETIVLSRGKGLTEAPFSNSYHKLEMFPGALYWKMGDPNLEFGPVKGSLDDDCRFESTNYFSKADYHALRGMDAKHPMDFIEQFSTRKDTILLNIDDLASFWGRPSDQVVNAIGNLTKGGYVTFDPESRMLQIRPKLFHAIRANAKRTDYDPIEIKSEVPGTQRNASLNLLNLDLTVYGVKRVTLSDSQFVKIYPKGEEMIIRKNRDMKFGGIVNAGSTEYFGQEFFYSYENHKIDLLQCDSMRLRVWPFNPPYDKQVRVKSVIRNVKGHIVIDGKDNKSGVKKDFHNYPILTSTTPTYVFYNDRSIHNGVYDSSSFYFKVDPFVMDSLDNFRVATQKFSGEFKSAGILPVLKEALSVQKDYSLGFIRKLPPEGIKLYGDKATFNNEIRLSNNGLQADGTIKFLTTTADSKAFTLFPDSLSGIAEKYKNVEQKGTVEVPEAHGVQLMVRYHPKAKVLYTQSRDSAIHMFDNTCKMRGTTALRPEGMTGRGRVYFNTAELTSRKFKFKSKIIDSDTANFRLKNHDLTNELAFKTDNVNAHIDFVQRLGEFKSNGNETKVEFPENEYICFMDRFKWFMDNEDIELESDKRSVSGNINIDTDIDLSGSNFFSVRQGQDSLNFAAPKAKFDLKKKVINCQKVEFVNVGDAKIYPDSNKVTIRRKADMDPLKNAIIVCNYVTKYHKITDATVKINGRKNYQASGKYAYVDENKMTQFISFANIGLDTTFQTYAKGEVKPEERFMLSPHFEYKGGVELKANDKGLNFNGATRLVFNCASLSRDWLIFKGVVDPNDIRIPIGDILVNYDGGGILGSGISISPDSVAVYPSFMSTKIKKDHPELIGATGFLIFDKRLQEYQISTDEKLKENTLPGNLVAFAKEKCELKGDGKMSFGLKTGQLKLTPIGSVNQNLATGKTSMKVALMVDFPFDKDILKKVGDKINNYPDIQPFEYEKSNYEKALRELIGMKDADKVIADLSLHGEVKRFPDELEKSMFFSDVTLNWIPEEGIWLSEGKIGISNFFNKQIFKYVDGRIMILKGRTFDVVSIVLKLDDSNWYFFTYAKELMEVVSSDSNFNKSIQETKDDKRKYKGEKGEQDFEYRFNSNRRSRAQELLDRSN